MASDINNIFIVGRLVRDAEFKVINSGTGLCKFSIATNRAVKQNDEWKTEVSFFDVVLWGKRAEALSKYLVKGKQIAVDGILVQNRWEQEGQTRSKVEILANNIQLFSSGNKTDKEDVPVLNESATSVDANLEDDLPF